MLTRLHLCGVALLIFGQRSGAQTPIPIRTLGPLVQSDSAALGAVNAVRVLSDGRALVSDGARYRLMMFDTTLKRFALVADTAGEAHNNYGRYPSNTIPYRGDSSVFYDSEARAFVVVSPSGAFARSMAMPPLSHTGVFQFDDRGRMVYQLPATRGLGGRGALNVPGGRGSGAAVDSTTYGSITSLMRVDFDVRLPDTLSKIAAMPQRTVLRNRTPRANGGS